jgi:hypothetical protein
VKGVADSSIVIQFASGITPEQARDARARAWSFIFECWQKKQKAAPASRPDDAEGSKNDRTATEIIPKPS